MQADQTDIIIEMAEPGDVEEIVWLFKRSRRAKLPGYGYAPARDIDDAGLHRLRRTGLLIFAGVFVIV